MNTFCFIGGGRITRILLLGLQRNNALPEKIIVYEPDVNQQNKLENLSIPGLNLKLQNDWEELPDIVFLALHPPVFKDILPQISEYLTPSSIVLSLAPVINMKSLQSLLSGFDRIVRMIPNAPSAIGKGYNPVTISDTLSLSEKDELYNLFSRWGKSPEVAENKLEAYAILSAMGPTYFWFQWLELKRLGIEFQLNEYEVATSIHQMICGASDLLFNSNFPAEEVLDMIPVRPLKEDEEQIQQVIYDRLTTLHTKLTQRK